MQFIKISNEAKFVNRLYLEKLGLSTKRDDENTIGQFGSGSKFAPIAALRKGLRWISVGEDELGPYQMEFVVMPEGDINSVFCVYEDVVKPTSFTLEAGMLSWEDDFQIFREAFANALDEHTEFGHGFSVELADEVKFEPGVFSTYITSTPELKDIVNNFDHYFSLNREVVKDSAGIGKILSLDGPGLNIYCKGVLIWERPQENNYPPLFNYEFPRVTLNEERRLRYESEIPRCISEIFGMLSMHSERDIETAEFILRNDKWKKYETRTLTREDVVSWDFDETSAFIPAFHNVFGENAGIYLLPQDKDTLIAHGFDPIKIESLFLYGILCKVGITNYEDLAGEEAKFDITTLDENQSRMFDNAMRMIREYDSMVDTLSIQFYNPRSEYDMTLGVAVIPGTKVFISTAAFSDLRTLIGTIVHELDHIVWSHKSHDDRFRGFADNRIASLIMKNDQLQKRSSPMYWDPI